MGIVDVERLLQASMGLSVEAIGASTIARAVHERRLACELASIDAYVHRVRGSGAELQALIEAVVVPETWFYRDSRAFSVLAQVAQDEWLPTHADGVFSVLSLPCATGEEPYSMAMALLDASVPTNRFHVDAVDISARNIAMATRAIYGKNSFRGEELGFRARHFDESTKGFHVSGAVRQQVRFQQANFFADDFLPGTAVYDVIFCRNVLIYFDRPTQDRALGILNRLLNANGVLFVAPAETALPTSHGMVATKEPLAFAFRRASAGTSKPKRTVRLVAPIAARRLLAPRATPLRTVRRPPFAPATAAGFTPVVPATAEHTELSAASLLADQGRFTEAAVACEEHIRRHGPSAAAFHLLGLMRDSTGSYTEAIGSYKRALYLDPNHYDSQIHLALLLERRGDPAGALVLRNRARRLEVKGKASHE